MVVSSSFRSLCVLCTFCLLLLVSVTPSVLLVKGAGVYNALNMKLGISPITQLFSQSVVNAYQVQTSQLTTDMSMFAAFDDSIPALLSSKVDLLIFGGSPLVQTRSQYQNLLVLPMAATPLVLAYNLPEIVGSYTFVVDAESICRIHTGNITRFDDPRLRALNPGVPLPATRIQLLINGAPASALFSLVRYCYKLLPDEMAATGIQANFQPIFLANNTVTRSWNEVATVLMDRVGGVAFIPYTVASTFGTQIALMKNRAGNVVSPTPTAVASTVIELASADVPMLDNGYDLFDPSSTQSWPIATCIYLILDKANNLSTCSARKAMLDFIFFIYSNEVTSKLSETIKYTMLPSTYIKGARILQKLQDSIYCNEKPLIDSTTNVATIQGISGSFFSLQLFTNFYSQVSSAYTFTLTPTDIDLVVRRLLKRETDIAVLDQRLTTSHLTDIFDTSVSSNGFGLVLPSLLSGVVPTFQLPLAITRAYALIGKPGTSPIINALPPLYPLVIDVETLAALYVGSITSWLDTRLTALNPQLIDWFGNVTAPTNLTKVVCCTNTKDPRVASSMFLMAINKTKTFTGSSVLRNPLVSDTINANILNGDWSTIISAASKAYGSTYLNIDVETRIVTKTVITPGSVSFKQISSAVTDITTEFQLLVYKDGNAWSDFLKAPVTKDATIVVDRSQMNVVAPIPTNLRPCVPDAELKKTTFIPTDTLLFNRYGSCYPLSTVLYFSVPTTYYSTSTSASSSNIATTAGGTGNPVCDRAAFSLRFISWFISSGFLASASSNNGLVRLTDDADLRNRIQDKLNHITCNDETILVVLPVVWSGGSSAVSVISVIMLAIFIPIFVISLGILYYYRQRPIVRSSSVLFLGLTLVGQMLMIISLPSWTASVTADNCSSFLWLSNVGFTLAFAPLFAKTYRIYAIFARRRLKVVKISNFRLLIAVAGLVLMDIILLAIWQGVSSFKPVTTVQIIGGRDHEITSCSVDSKGMGFLGAVAVLKFVLLLFGSLCSFATRQVHSAFNESSQIGWSIYNTVFSALIIAAIQAFVKPVEDQHVIVVLFLIIWINIGLYVFLFVPKWLGIFNDGKVVENGNNSSMTSHKTTSDGFSFVSIDTMGVTTLKLYIKNLLQQVQVAKKRLLAMGGSMNTNEDGSEDSRRPVSKLRERERDAESTVLNNGGGGGGNNNPTAARTGSFGPVGGPSHKYRLSTDSRVRSADTNIEMSERDSRAHNNGAASPTPFSYLAGNRALPPTSLAGPSKAQPQPQLPQASPGAPSTNTLMPTNNGTESPRTPVSGAAPYSRSLLASMPSNASASTGLVVNLPGVVTGTTLSTGAPSTGTIAHSPNQAARYSNSALNGSVVRPYPANHMKQFVNSVAAAANSNNPAIVRQASHSQITGNNSGIQTISTTALASLTLPSPEPLPGVAVNTTHHTTLPSSEVIASPPRRSSDDTTNSSTSVNTTHTSSGQTAITTHNPTQQTQSHLDDSSSTSETSEGRDDSRARLVDKEES